MATPTRETITREEFDKRLDASNERRRDELQRREEEQTRVEQLLTYYEHTLDEIEGELASSFRVVEAPSRLAVARAIVESPDIWSRFLHDAHLYDPIMRGGRPYYADPRPVTAEEALRLSDRSSVDGDSRARMSIHPIMEILTQPLSEPQAKQAATASP